MSRPRFLSVDFDAGFPASYAVLSADRQKATDRAMLALIKQETTPGMHIKPIQPDKYFYEARINQADRLIYRIHQGEITFVDVVAHDDIGRYGKRPTTPR